MFLNFVLSLYPIKPSISGIVLGTEQYCSNLLNSVNRLGSVQAIYYINDQRLKVIKDYDGLKRFQVTWDALMNSSGKIESTTGSIYYRLIGTANNQDIEVSDVCVYYSEVDKAGDSFFASFYVEIEPSDLMKANSISFMWWDKIIDDTATKNISLMGFTKAYQHNK